MFTRHRREAHRTLRFCSSLFPMKTVPTTIAPTTTTGSRRFHTMVKPTGSICNLDCSYCYYLHKEELLGSTSKFHMSDEVLETHIRQYIEGQDGAEVVFLSLIHI